MTEILFILMVIVTPGDGTTFIKTIFEKPMSFSTCREKKAQLQKRSTRNIYYCKSVERK